MIFEPLAVESRCLHRMFGKSYCLPADAKFM